MHEETHGAHNPHSADRSHDTQKTKSGEVHLHVSNVLYTVYNQINGGRDDQEKVKQVPVPQFRFEKSVFSRGDPTYNQLEGEEQPKENLYN
jgi:hypothetical protein